MRFPTITNYTEAVSSLADRLRTLHDIQPLLDPNGEPLFYSSKGMVNFSIMRNGQLTSMRCFISVSGYEKAQDMIESGMFQGEIIENELLVFNDNYSPDYYPIMIQATESMVLTTPKTQSVFKTAESPEPFLSDDKLWGYRDDKSQTVIEPQFTSASEFREGRAVVEIDGMLGLIDSDGNHILDICYDDISWDGSAIAYVEKDGKWGCFDRSGRLISDCNYEWMGEFSQSLLLVRNNGKYGYLNLKGEEAIPLIYDSATSFDENRIASVTVCGRHAMINTNGEFE